MPTMFRKGKIEYWSYLYKELYIWTCVNSTLYGPYIMLNFQQVSSIIFHMRVRSK